ncbi:MAG: porin family protein [Aphanothece sp. CMT-3BRIN-NPC111]|jgi:hypothetical protein|nr:porin family protein [Aphanothece sp. CMT-3BRIN-NPC111]
MKGSLPSVLKISVVSALAITPLLLSGNGASANPAMNDTYVGAGVTGSVTRGDSPSQDAQFGGNITGRVAIPNVPISARASVIFNDNTSAVVPVITYDMGVAKNTNVFVGGGASLVQNTGSNTPIGDQNAAVVTAGVESKVTNNLVLYGDTKVGINAYKDSATPAITFSAGAGFNF